MKAVRVHEWIVLEEGKTLNLLLTAKRKVEKKPDEVEVKILSETDPERLLAEGIMVFGNQRPSPPEIRQINFKSEGPFRFEKERFYTEHLFLGPTFQSIVSINHSGEDGAEATLKVPANIRMFRSTEDPEFIIDPILVDGAGQVVSLWAQGHLDSGFIAFPYGLEALYLYGPSPSPLTPITCYIRPNVLPDGQIWTDIDLVGPGNQMVLRIVSWQNMRFFDWTRAFIRFILAPCENILCEPWPDLVSHLRSQTSLQCCRFLKKARGVWFRILEHLILSRHERTIYSQLAGPHKRHEEWLIGRLAAKDAVRLYIKERYKMDTCPADIEITSDEYGHPIAGGDIIQKIGCNLSLSLAHTEEEAVAVACAGDDLQGVGIDVESICQNHEELGRVSLSPEEESLLADVPSSQKGEWVTRFWCAKEAVAKALGRGMAGGPWNLLVKEMDVKTGRVEIKLAGELARQIPGYANGLLIAHTTNEDDRVFAISLIRKRER